MDVQDLIRDRLACPACRSPLRDEPGRIACTSCGVEFVQPAAPYLELMIPSKVEATDDLWQTRLDEMDGWYNDLIAQPAEAFRLIRKDYELFPASVFACSGPVLDIGGGTGVTQHFLPEAAVYVCLDPDLSWIRPDWTAFHANFREEVRPRLFVHGVGEYLPFRDASFERAFAFWSLNHSREPGQVLKEACRVLQPGGLFFVVLEDTVPRLRDMAGRLRFALSGRYWAVALARSLRTVLTTGAWPLQKDHIRVREADLKRWIERRFTVRRRRWYGNYLTFELIKEDTAGW